MSRLASFRGPSTPSSSPVRLKEAKSPASPSARSSETTFHRKIRSSLQELRSITRLWDDLVLHDGVKALKGLTDARTELTNELALLSGKQPHYRVVSPKLAIMEKNIEELDIIVAKLQKQFQRLNSVIDAMEALLSEAHKIKGWNWCTEEPMWTTWPMEKFVSSIPDILVPYHRALEKNKELVSAVRKHSTSFGDSRSVLSQWIEQSSLQEGGWNTQWEDLCAVEVERWNDSR